MKTALDRGGHGVAWPPVTTAAHAAAAVAAAKVPPDGIRGVAGTRASRYGLDLPDYVAHWNEEVLVICQLETAEAVRNAEAIAAVPGVDVLFIRPNDLSASLAIFPPVDKPEHRRPVPH